MDSINWPPGYQWSFGEGVEQDDADTRAMVANTFLLAVLMIYIVMAALFESLLHPAAILSGIVFSIFGVFWFFLITGTSFGYHGHDRHPDPDGCGGGTTASS